MESTEPTEEQFEVNKGVVLHGPNVMKLDKLEVPDLQGNEVLIRMGSVGICGSDLKYWKYAKCGRFTMSNPMVIGHEGSGTVVQCGPEVRSLKIGDQVAIEPGIPCRQCTICHKGRYNLCSQMRFCATPPVHGNLCSLYKHPEDFCYKLPASVSLDQGAMMEPLAVAVYACERGGVGLSSNILICGAGPVGLLVLMVGKAMGADQILVTDISDERLAMARQLGATHTFNMKNQTSNMEDFGARLQSYCSIDATIECSGADSSMNLGVHSTRPGGSVVMVGRGSMEPTIPLVKAATFEIDIKGVFRYANCYPRAVSLVANGAVKPELLITHHFKMAESEEAFKCASDVSAGSIKVMIHCQ